MSALALVAVFGGVLALYTLIEDLLWACSRRPMARPLSRRQLKRRYRQRLHSVVALERQSAQYAARQRELMEVRIR